MSKDEILEAIKGMSVLELSELVKDLEEQFGVSAAAPVAVAAPVPQAAANGGAPAALLSSQRPLVVRAVRAGCSAEGYRPSRRT